MDIISKKLVMKLGVAQPMEFPAGYVPCGAYETPDGINLQMCGEPGTKERRTCNARLGTDGTNFGKGVNAGSPMATVQRLAPPKAGQKPAPPVAVFMDCFGRVG